ncbi:hypothetical protein LQG66_21070 [Bradyrhizobium ontarionense]|uniref:Uncharacterized protein n=1 Tax=Bradyrhizobium ontarionense TaxID=2898149 RepID=A0ABY3R3E3_9BRAD|nr:hypothetical protein [Bradyrhizobium sp. A19]UFZ01805.1 hypothetical protein LQG66_21070 [Bradyrhizobium sp. A19]
MPSRAAIRQTLACGAAGFLICSLLGITAAGAADAAIPRREARHVKATTEYDVYPRRIRHRHWGCSDRYSCMALYGAYGPYGGPGYWGAYTGWYR